MKLFLVLTGLLSASVLPDLQAKPVAQAAPAPALAPDLAPNPASNPVAVAHPRDPKLPTVFIASDSTAAKDSGPILGWGEPFHDYFDPAKINVVNRARAGRSSRTFITEGLWDGLLADVKAGDFVLIQFGHNDAGAINAEPPGSTRPLRARGSLPGVGEESTEIDNVLTHRHEVVHTFGWYVRRMIADVKARGATPIVLSLTVRNIWKDAKVERENGPALIYREDGTLALDHEEFPRPQTTMEGLSALKPSFAAMAHIAINEDALTRAGLAVVHFNSGIDAAAVASQPDLTLVNEGQLAEQLVGQELRACRPFNEEPALFTWVREAKNSNAEVDYVIQVGTRIVPVEVKAGATGTLRSLHMMVAEKKLDLAVRVSSTPLQRRKIQTALPFGTPGSFTLLSIPFYLVSEIPRLVGAIRKG